MRSTSRVATVSSTRRATCSIAAPTRIFWASTRRQSFTGRRSPGNPGARAPAARAWRRAPTARRFVPRDLPRFAIRIAIEWSLHRVLSRILAGDPSLARERERAGGRPNAAAGKGLDDHVQTCSNTGPIRSKRTRPGELRSSVRAPRWTPLPELGWSPCWNALSPVARGRAPGSGT